jgi:alanine-synthesizing transaminase
VRREIIHEGSGQLTYEIRGIVKFARELEQMGVEITWENIGDPIQKGEPMPEWIKEIILDLASHDRTYGYVDTQGLPETREFLAHNINIRGGCQVTRDDIVFFNGLGDAVNKVFGFLKREARVIGPAPAYSTHSSAEAAHSGYEHLTYQLDPHNNWMPDLEDIENKVRYNDSIAGLMLINPDNPTGAVYPRGILKAMVDIARRYGIFIICDEIYAHIVYNGTETMHMSEVIEDVPGLAMRGISKEYPWPGGRCGWIEVFNQDKYPDFKGYISSIINAKMLEVCSTSLPQYSIPPVIGSDNYPGHLKRRSSVFQARAKEAVEMLSGIDGVVINEPKGAFYMSIMFEPGVLNGFQKLEISDKKIRRFIENRVRNVPNDKRFVYYLLAATGICVVPLTGFCCDREGFRVTLLECDDEKRRWTWKTIARAIKEYTASAP